MTYRSIICKERKDLLQNSEGVQGVLVGLFLMISIEIRLMMNIITQLIDIIISI